MVSQAKLNKMMQPIVYSIEKQSQNLPLFRPDYFHTTWKIKLEFRGNSMECFYVTRIGDFDKTVPLKYVLNSFFTNSKIYETHDFFQFAEKFGAGFNSPKEISNMYNKMKEGNEDLHRVFGNDFDRYSEVFRSIRPVTELGIH